MLGTVGCVSPQELLALARDMGEAQESGGSAAIDTEATTAAKTTSRAETTTRAETPSGVEESEAAAACVRITIVDEARKLPMRALVDAQGCTEYASHQAWVAIFERFFEDFKINEDDITDAINALIDWQDASCESPDGSRSGGAEDDYYQGLEKPYSIPYLPMQVPGELRLVRHFTCEALAKLFPGKECKDVADLDLGSNNYLTPYGGWGDEARVNINTATEAVLRALIPDETCIEDILERRGVGFEGQLLDVEPFQDVSQVCGGALPQDANTTIGFRSNYFRVEAIGEVEGLIKKKIVAVLSRSGQGNQPGDGPQMVYFKVE
jgi:type II secretory pathway component PulK